MQIRTTNIGNKLIRLLHDLIIHAAENFPEKSAIIQGDNELSYGEVYERSLRLSHFLKKGGIKRGDRVCFHIEKRFEKVISIFGICMAGGVFVPIGRLAHAIQIAHIINDCGSELLITTVDRVPSILGNRFKYPKLHRIIAIGEPGYLSSTQGVEVIFWEEIMRSYSVAYIGCKAHERDLAAILYTSGSTGKPKGVVLNHLNIVEGAKKVSEYLKITEKDRLLSILSFGFDYGLNQLTTSFLNCAQLILFEYLFPKDIIRAVEKYSITGLAAVSTTWIQLIESSWDGSSMKNLRYITNTGGSIPPHFVLELRKRLPTTDIYLMYGLTEAFRSTYLDPSLVAQLPHSIGKAIPGEDLLVLDANGRPVEPGQVGELVHRGVLVSQGYWNDPERTAIRFRPNPLQPKEIPIPEVVVYSGDYVRMDENGFLYFIGRTDDMIKCAGNRISPTEVEEILYRFEFIADAVAFGTPHDVYGQTVFVVVSLSPGADIDVAGIRKRCREEMPPFMIPNEIRIWDKLPKNTNGKLDRAIIKKKIKMIPE